MFPAVWNFFKTPYYEFVVVKEPELVIQWKEYHKEREPTKLPGVYPSKKDNSSAFHVLKGHVPYKEGVKSTVYFGSKNGLNRTGPHQYYPLEDYETLIAVQHPEEVFEIPVIDQETGEEKKDKDTGEPIVDVYRPIRYVSVESTWLKDFYESRADHKVQAEPPPSGLAALLPYLIPIMLIILVIYIISVLTGHPILGQ